MDQDLRRVCRAMVAVANTLAALTGAGLVLLHKVAPDAIRAGILDTLLFPALVVLALNLARAIWLRQPHREPGYIVSRGRRGVVRISKEAIEASLRAACEKAPEVTRVRVTVSPEGLRRVLVRAFYTAAEGARPMEVSERLRDTLRERYAEMVNPEAGSQVEFQLEFEGFSGKPARKPAEGGKPGRKEEDAPPPFTGPRYPIDDGDEA